MGAGSYNRIHKVRFVPSVDISGAYTSGDALWTGTQKLEAFLQGFKHSGKIISVSVADAAKQSAALAFHFFSAAITGGTLTKNVALAFADADLASYYLGSVLMPAANYNAFADNSAGSNTNIQLGIKTESEDVRDVYVVGSTTGTPTYVAATDLTITFAVQQDG